ncbi:MAG: ribose 5-phosphate isomerase B [Bacteroidetes bacterium HGW-Bacteroidetes-7]|jgi:ribose 5-phosphate isomerase B|nr:MAG: ribose 5-phosphate isomerase B [Bacteroidetes bacterium HGW-Bacteroidetes-7]
MKANIKTIGIASDHAGFDLKKIITDYLTNLGIKVDDFGTHSAKSMDYPDIAHPLANSVERREVEAGIAICGSGNGINMTVNKHQGIRAALCWTPELAKLAREHNDANILSLPARFISPETALEIVSIFISTSFEGGRHETRVNKINCQ